MMSHGKGTAWEKQEVPAWGCSKRMMKFVTVGWPNVKKKWLPNMQSWLLMAWKGEWAACTGRWGLRKWQGEGCLPWNDMVKAAAEETNDGARESQKCDNEVQRTWLCSSMWKAVSERCHAQRECMFLQGRKAESCALTPLCSQQLTSNHSLTYWLFWHYFHLAVRYFLNLQELALLVQKQSPELPGGWVC